MTLRPAQGIGQSNRAQPYGLGYLADVYVLSEHRGRGLGIALVSEAVESQPTWRWLLHTADAHDLYRKVGFDSPPDSLMERPRPS